MHFCSVCSNMYYISINSDDANKLIYYCRNCGNEDSTIQVEHLSVSKIQLKQNTKDFNTFINKYTKFDPTLPRTNKIKCPKAECTSNIDDKINNEIIYIRYDDINMNYVYLCANCDCVWTAEQNNSK